MLEAAHSRWTHAPQRHSEHARCLLVVGALLLEVKHPEEIAAAQRKLAYGFANPLGALEMEDFGEGRPFGHDGIGCQVGLGPDTRPLQVVETQVPCGHDEPARQRLTVPQSGGVSMQPEESLLEKVLGFLGGNSERPDRRVHQTLVVRNDLPPRGVISLRRPTEQVGGNMHGRSLMQVSPFCDKPSRQLEAGRCNWQEPTGACTFLSARPSSE